MPQILKPYVPEPTRLRRIAVRAGGAALLVFCVLYGFGYALTTPFLLLQFVAPLVPLVALALWALPDMPKAPTEPLFGLFAAYVATAALWPNYIALNPPGLPWITMIRLIGLPFALTLLICVSVSAEVRTSIKNSLFSVPKLPFVLLGFFALQLLSIVFSSQPVSSANVYLDAQISLTAMFFGSCYLFLRPGRFERFVVLLWLCALVLVAIGLWEHHAEQVPWAGHIPSFLQVGDDYVQKVLGGARRLGTNEYRLQANHSTSLGFAEFMALVSPFLIHIAVSRYSRFLRFAAAATLPVIFYIIVETGARLGAIGFLLGSLLYLVSWAFLRWRRNRSSLLGPILIFGAPVAAVVIFVATLVVGRLRLIIWGGANTSYSTQGRFDQYEAGLPKIMSHPWGYGIGRGAEELGYRNLNDNLTIDTYYLLAALDYGLVGAALYFLSILLVAYASIKISHFNKLNSREEEMLIPLSISLIVFFVIKAVFSQTENHFLQFIFMGAACALVFRARKSQAAAGQMALGGSTRSTAYGRAATPSLSRRSKSLRQFGASQDTGKF